MKIRILLSTIISVLVLGSSITTYAQPKTMSDGNIFDAEFYANTYADVKTAFGNDETALYKHYLEHGKAEGRQPYAEGTVLASVASDSDDFDVEYYAKNNPDVVAALGNDETVLYQHYINHGKKEGRLPNAAATAPSKSNTGTQVVVKSSNNSTESAIVPSRNEASGHLVWVPTKGGKKYHVYSTCSGMIDPMHVSINTAIANGYTACKRCH